LILSIPSYARYVKYNIKTIMTNANLIFFDTKNTVGHNKLIINWNTKNVKSLHQSTHLSSVTTIENEINIMSYNIGHTIPNTYSGGLNQGLFKLSYH